MALYLNFRYSKRQRGQAILELAIYGALLIMLLGILINYGLRYNAQQKIMQQSFRKALASASHSMSPGTPISVSHLVIRDQHIPSPSDPFAVGSVLPSSGSGSVTRNYKLQETPDIPAELPHVEIDIQGQTLSFKTAGFRNENINQASLPRYEEVYGASNVWGSGSGSITIMDSCAGEVINYDSAVRQCRTIVDSWACTQECIRGGGKNCSSTCSLPMNVPWYCQDYAEIDHTTHRYVFGVLERLFQFAHSKNKGMGLQDDTTQITTANNRLQKRETATGITTTDTLDWQTDSQRKIVYKTYGTTGTSTNTRDVQTSVSQNTSKTWQSNW